jgi:hypothetical protein
MSAAPEPGTPITLSVIPRSLASVIPRIFSVIPGEGRACPCEGEGTHDLLCCSATFVGQRTKSHQALTLRTVRHRHKRLAKKQRISSVAGPHIASPSQGSDRGRHGNGLWENGLAGGRRALLVGLVATGLVDRVVMALRICLVGGQHRRRNQRRRWQDQCQCDDQAFTRSTHERVLRVKRGREAGEQSGRETYPNRLTYCASEAPFESS